MKLNLFLILILCSASYASETAANFANERLEGPFSCPWIRTPPSQTYSADAAFVGLLKFPKDSGVEPKSINLYCDSKKDFYEDRGKLSIETSVFSVKARSFRKLEALSKNDMNFVKYEYADERGDWIEETVRVDKQVGDYYATSPSYYTVKPLFDDDNNLANAKLAELSRIYSVEITLFNLENDAIKFSQAFTKWQFPVYYIGMNPEFIYTARRNVSSIRGKLELVEENERSRTFELGAYDSAMVCIRLREDFITSDGRISLTCNKQGRTPRVLIKLAKQD